MPTDPLARREQLTHLDHAISRLRTADQTLILMRYFQSMELVDISQSLAISEPAARKRLTRAVQRLRRNFIDRDGQIDGLLAGASVAAAPDAVRSAALNVHRLATASPAAAALATGATISPLVPAGALAAAVLLAAGAMFLRTSSSSKPANAPAIVAPVVQSKLKPTREQWAELKRTYALSDGQNVRLIYPPYTAVRSVFFGDDYETVLFYWRKGDAMDTGVGRGSLNLNSILSILRIPWFQIEAVDTVAWDRTNADVVQRVDSTVEQRLRALAGIISERSNVPVELQQRIETRPCIVVHGPGTKPVFNDVGDGRPVLLLTQVAWNATRLKPFQDVKAAPYPRGTIRNELLNADAFESLDTPFFMDDLKADRHVRVLVAPDAHLNHDDPRYETQLGRVLANVHEQLGGDWRIEPRDIVVYRFVATGM